jgi:hypothetical protein
MREDNQPFLYAHLCDKRESLFFFSAVMQSTYNGWS